MAASGRTRYNAFLRAVKKAYGVTHAQARVTWRAVSGRLDKKATAADLKKHPRIVSAEAKRIVREAEKAAREKAKQDRERARRRAEAAAKAAKTRREKQERAVAIAAEQEVIEESDRVIVEDPVFVTGGR